MPDPASSLVVSDLFVSTCIAFEKIRVVRSLGPDFAEQAVRLEVLQLRLSRWGAVNQHLIESSSTSQEELHQIRKTLVHIQDSLSEAERISKRYQKRARPVVEDPDFSTLPKTSAGNLRLHSALRTVVIARQQKQRSSLKDSVRWSLYDREALLTLIRDLTVFIEGLENLTSSNLDQQVKLSVEDVESVERELGTSLSELCEEDVISEATFAQVDPVLEWCVAVRYRIDQRSLTWANNNTDDKLPSYDEVITDLARIHHFAKSSAPFEPFGSYESGSYTEFFCTGDYRTAKDAYSQQIYHHDEWVLEHPTYKEWRYGTDSNILWINAPPKLGKSVLMRGVVDKNLLAYNPSGIVYYFWEDVEDSKGFTDVLCALLHQIFSNFPALSRKYARIAIEEYGQELRTDTYSLWNIFINAANDASTGNILLVLDSLDNCHAGDRWFIKELVKWHSLSRDGKLKLLLTSRSKQDYAQTLAQSTKPVSVLQLGALNTCPQVLREVARDERQFPFQHLGAVIKNGYAGRCDEPVMKLSDKFKNAVERILHQPVIWWPLEDPVRPKSNGCERIAWKCDCGSVLYCDLPRDLASGRTDTQFATNALLPLPNRAWLGQDTRRNSLQNTNTTIGSGNLPQDSIHRATNTPSNSSTATQLSLPNTPSHEKYIHWCVDQNSSTTWLKHVDVHGVHDSNFTVRLLREYSSISRWRDFWEMRDCAGARFKAFYRMRQGEDLIAPGKTCLPDVTNNEYEWTHFIPLDRFQIITEAEIRHRFRTRETLLQNQDLLDRIPKKIPIKLAGTRGIKAYGLHAYRWLAWWRVLTMGLIYNSVGVAVLIWKLDKNSRDLQTAFVVIGTTMALFMGYFAIAVYFGVEAEAAK